MLFLKVEAKQSVTDSSILQGGPQRGTSVNDLLTSPIGVWHSEQNRNIRKVTSNHLNTTAKGHFNIC